jgi:plastocyanin
MDPIRTIPTIVSILVLAGCAAARVEGTAQPLPAGGYGVTMELVSFAFRPNVVTVEAGRPITITAKNESWGKHNVTIRSPRGELVKSTDVPGGQTRTFDLTLTAPVRYVLSCDVFLHPTFGMTGEFIAR